jgi:hypothetical protein
MAIRYVGGDEEDKEKSNMAACRYRKIAIQKIKLQI